MITQPYKLEIYWRDGKFAACQFETKSIYLDAEGTVILEKPNPPEDLDLAAIAALAPDINTAALARIAELEKELAEAKAVPQQPVADNTELITALHTAFTTTLPLELQSAFAMPYTIVRFLAEKGEYYLAASVITGITVPPEYEAAKQGLIDLLPL